MENVIVAKSMAFAIRIVNLYKYFVSEKNEYVMSKQLLKSGGSYPVLHMGGYYISPKRDSSVRTH